MNILVTGSQGQVGSELLKALPPSSTIIGLARCDLDLANPSMIRSVLSGLKPNLIINAAAYTAVDRAESEANLARAINADAVGVIGKEARRLGAAVIHYSTDYIFDGHASSPYSPGAVPNPKSVYGQTKLDGEIALKSSGAQSLILRTGWVYGLTGRNFLLALVRNSVSHGELKVVDDQKGSPTPARLIAQLTAQVISEAMRSKRLDALKGVHHLTAAGSATWFDFATAIFELLPVRPKPAIARISTSEYPTRAVRPAYSVLDCSSFDQTFGLTRPHWRDALAELLRGVSVESLLTG